MFYTRAVLRCLLYNVYIFFGVGVGVGSCLNRQRRVSRFKPCLCLRLRCCSACGLAFVFATFDGFILPFCACGCRLRRYICTRAIQYIRIRKGEQGIVAASVGGGHLHVQF